MSADTGCSPLIAYGFLLPLTEPGNSLPWWIEPTLCMPDVFYRATHHTNWLKAKW
jgi:hypothetical protein